MGKEGFNNSERKGRGGGGGAMSVTGANTNRVKENRIIQK